MKYKVGLINHPLYGVWSDIKRRCYKCSRPRFKDYGGRGITVCPQWLHDFKSFYDWAIANGYQEGLQIDRIDNDGHYEPSNCRFVTSQENQLNRRLMKNNNSGYRNVYYDKNKKKWIASVRLNKKSHYIGRFENAELAAVAYDLYVIENDLPNKLNIFTEEL